jgi:2-octaprenyl-3-methyl-6-methoxy-1,4-benzoquinol hydroxylase/2-octaprenylphenol hydroxylase
VSRAGTCDLAVVGAGAVGAALALAAARAGLDVALIERREPAAFRLDDEIDLRVFALSPASRNTLDRLGVWAPIAATRACAYRAMRVWDAAGSGEIAFDATLVGEDALGYIVEGRLLQHVLWQALRESARIEVFCPAELVECNQGAERVELVMSDGRRLGAQLAVAADGAESPLRALAGIPIESHDYTQRAVVAHLRCAASHQDTAWQRFLPGGPLALLPLLDGRVSIVWSLPEAQAQAMLALDDDEFCAAVSRASDERLGAMSATTARASFPLRRQLAERYAQGRVALVGDAAHVVHPLAGQGMNLGLLDAATLAAELQAARAAKLDLGDGRVLARYARARQGENALAARTFESLGAIYAADLPLWARLRGAGLAVLNALPPLKRQIALHACGYGGQVPPLARRT